MHVLRELLLVVKGYAGLADEIGIRNIFELLRHPFDLANFPLRESFASAK